MALALDLLNLLVDLFHKGGVGVLGILEHGHGMDDLVVTALAVEETEGLVDIDGINGLFVAHELGEQVILARIALEDELVIAHDLELVDSVVVVLTGDIHRHHLDVRHVQVEGLSHPAH